MKIRLLAHQLEVAYDNFLALKCPNIDSSGTIVAVLGHNGAGKSTLIKTILDLLPVKHGQLRVTDENGQLLRPEAHMAFCPETGSVFEDISVEDYIRLWCRIKHQDARYYKREGAKYVELLELSPLLRKLGRELSKGQRRRVQTAIGFFTQPKLFLFDEPFDGLDVQKTTELTDIIADHAPGMSFLISSHRMDVIERLADQVIVLKDGSVAAAGTVDEVSRVLCGKAAVISNASQPALLLETLRFHFRDDCVSRLGDSITLAGEAFDMAAVLEIVKEVDRNGAQVTSARPSLTDAMNYHLRRIKVRA